MNQQLSNLLDRVKPLQQCVTGLVQDFWKDGSENPLGSLLPFGKTKIEAPHSESFAAHGTAVPMPALVAKPARPGLWHAVPGEIPEKMWGQNFVLPGDEALSDMLVAPLNLKQDMSLLDISAGLGGRLRKLIDTVGLPIAGLESDPEIAARGMELSITAGKGRVAAIATYDPTNFSVAKTYDCVIAREAFYRIADKPKFFQSIAASTKAKAQLSFTDYIIEAGNRAKPAIAKWQAYETGSAPLSVSEMAEGWIKAGFTVKTSEDQTDFYRKTVLNGLKQFAIFMGIGAKPDTETKKAVLKTIETWVHRMAAMEQGLKFYRFYATKP